MRRTALAAWSALAPIGPSTTPRWRGATDPSTSFEGFAYNDGWRPISACSDDAPSKRWTVDVEEYVYDFGAVLVVAGGTDKSVTVQGIDLATGSDVWSAVVSGGDLGPGAVRGVGDVVLVTRRHQDLPAGITLFDTADGRVIFDGRGSGGVFPQPIGDLVVLSESEESVAINGESGEERWRVDGAVESFDGTLVNRVKPRRCEPSLFGVLDGVDGDLQWDRPRPDDSNVIAIGGTVLLLPGPSPDLTAFDALSGDELWNLSVERTEYPGVLPLGDGDLLLEGRVAATGLRRLSAIDGATGSVRWESDSVYDASWRTWRADGQQRILMTPTDGDGVHVVDEAGETVSSRDQELPGSLLACAGLFFGQDAAGVTAFGINDIKPA